MVTIREGARRLVERLEDVGKLGGMKRGEALGVVTGFGVIIEIGIGRGPGRTITGPTASAG